MLRAIVRLEIVMPTYTSYGAPKPTFWDKLFCFHDWGRERVVFDKEYVAERKSCRKCGLAKTVFSGTFNEWRDRNRFQQSNASLSIPDGEPGYAPGNCSLSDTDRLVWLRRNMSGVEMRRIGICMDNTGDTEEFRKRIDEFIIANNSITGAR